MDAPEPLPPGATGHETEYELQRLRRIAENRERMKARRRAAAARRGRPGSVCVLPPRGSSGADAPARGQALNIGFMAAQIAAPRRPPPPLRAPRPAAPRAPREHAPRSVATRAVAAGGDGEPLRYADWSDDEDDDQDAPRRVDSGRRAHMPSRSAWDGARSFAELPPLLDPVTGAEIPRLRSCHVCTQCLASWRGNFTVPLGCRRAAQRPTPRALPPGSRAPRLLLR
jgi:hypothetical protein